MEKLKLLLLMLIIIVSAVLAVAKFLLIEGHDFWVFVSSLRW